VAYSNLINAALVPPTGGGVEAWQTQADWITTLTQNLMAAANELRPMQARSNLEAMMKRQLELRRQETAAIHSKCDEIEAELDEMRLAAKASACIKNAAFAAPPCPVPDKNISPYPSNTEQGDVLLWTEEVR